MVVALAMLAGGTSLLAQDDRARSALDNLVAAYPTALAGHDERVLRWRDGTVMPISDSADSETPSERLRHASIIDQFRIPYPRGPLEKPPAVDADPGRFRNTAFFTKMYSDCQKGRGVAAPCFPRLASEDFGQQDLGQFNPHHVRERRRAGGGITSIRCTSNFDPNSLLRSEIGIPFSGDSSGFARWPRVSLPVVRANQSHFVWTKNEEAIVLVQLSGRQLPSTATRPTIRARSGELDL